MAKKSEELLPCPFCGNDNVSVSRYVREKKPWHVGCPQGKCFLHGFQVVGYATREEAIAAWNKRFVCPDKNGDKVFAGDKVKFITGPMTSPKGVKTTGRVSWDQAKMAFMVEVPSYDMLAPLHFMEEIELIKEPGNG